MKMSVSSFYIACKRAVNVNSQIVLSMGKVQMLPTEVLDIPAFHQYQLLPLVIRQTRLKINGFRKSYQWE